MRGSYSFSGLGVFAIFGLLNPEHPNMVVAVLCAVIPFVFSFVLAFLLYREEAQAASSESNAPAVPIHMEIAAPVPGKVVPLTEVPDATFSEGLLGHGFAVEPAEGKVYAPFDGTCDTMFETLHAMGLTSDSGVSVLIHVGLETVGLEGKPFTAHIQSGDRIQKGQLLLEFDMDAIRAAGLPIITPILVTNEDEVGEVAVVNDRIVIGE